MAKRMTVPKEPTSIRLTPEAKQLLALLAQESGVTQAAWMETIIRREAKRRKIEVKEEAECV